MTVDINVVRETLRQPLIARLATIGADGYPHVVPLWYMMEEDRDEIAIMSDSVTRKVKNALLNAHGAVQIGGDPAGGGQNRYTPAYLFQGDFVVEDDPDHIVTAQITRRYLDSAAADRQLEAWKNDDVVVVRLRIKKIVQVY